MFERFVNFLKWLIRWPWWHKPEPVAPTRQAIQYVPIPRAAVQSPNPPAGSWSPCHPSTMIRFKASMTCPEGHGLTLKGHHIFADGRVHPSVICPVPSCSFHEFVTLKGWTFGELE